MRVLRLAGTGLGLIILAIALLGNWMLGLFVLGGLLLGLCVRNRKLLIGLLILGPIAALFGYLVTRPPQVAYCLAATFDVR